MSLRIYNTLTRKKEEFEPVKPGKVGMYVCGVTVYDMCHIGHARSVVLFDVIYRYLLKTGHEVTYVRNFTDVDDKIINRANQLGENWKSLAERFIKEFYIDMDALGVRRPTVEPKATEHIPQIQSIIGKLITRGHAYEVDGDVMFSVESFKSYGKLSGKKTDELMAGARVEVDDKKENPLDFALWKAAKPGEPSWDSPWGPGRPGWHIECSAMSMEYLGERFDIHGGGSDLTFPHHENEIAQSEGATGKPFARYWIHNGFVNIRSEKMSKSLGNVLNIRDILKIVHPDVLRLFLLSSHYRSPLDYSENSIKEASAGLERLYAALDSLKGLISAQGTAEELPPELSGITERFTQAMDDDFNTPRGLAVIFEAARAINRIVTEAGSSKENIPSQEKLAAVHQEMIDLAREVLGLLSEDPRVFLEDMRERELRRLQELKVLDTTLEVLNREQIEAKILERAEARKQKDFARADEIRQWLADRKVHLKDGPDGTTWEITE
ncbi:MAG: cysteine--tRNA ligase [Desulfomonile tiedjei]|nr:cysteine--tRNA ligase [Desulfomonile tiedjei]